MRPFIILLGLLSFIQANAQQSILSFDYDDSGSQTLREFQIISHSSRNEDRMMRRLKEENFNHYFSLSPNPSQVETTLRWESHIKIIKINIYDYWGRLIQSYPIIDKNAISATFNVSPWINGVYFFNVYTTDNRIVKIKFIK